MTTEIFAVRLYLKSPSSPDQPLAVHQPVSVGIEVRNVSPDPVWVVGVLEGSEVGLRFPHYLPSIEGECYEAVVPEWPDMTAPLRPGDFRLLQPNEGFDPTESSPGVGYMPLIAFRDFVPPVAGRYRLCLTLSTASKRSEEWLGTLPYPAQTTLLPRVAQIPACRVVSNLLTVDVG
jgi:hypothetical protein